MGAKSEDSESTDESAERVSTWADQEVDQTAVEDEDQGASIYGKRKRARQVKQSEDEQPRVKRVRAAYSSAYLDEFNQSILDISSSGLDGAWLHPEPSHFGLSYWTSEEKESFFRALARHGRNNLSAAVKAVGTKSEMQVLEYLYLLEDGALEVETTSKSKNLVRSNDLPAAAELSQEACDCLDVCAESLSFLVREDEENAEKSIFEEDWLVTAENCPATHRRRLKDVPQSRPTNPPEKLASALTLFDCPQLLELSERVFMTSAERSEAWFTLAAPDDKPALFASALLDLHTLVISKTKSLISASLLSAMSRIRAYDVENATGEFGPVRADVKAIDVHVALKSAGMPRDSAAFWRDAPRRLKLRVVEDPELSYDAHPETAYHDDDDDASEVGLKTVPLEEVERLLSRPDLEPEFEDGAVIKTIPLRPAKQEDTSARSSSLMSSVLTSSISDEGSVDSSLEAEEAETAFLESADQQASRREEARLLALLPTEITEHVNKVRMVDSPNMTTEGQFHKERKTPRELAIEDWRTHASNIYRPDWERYGHEIPDAAFEANGTGLGSAPRLPPVLRADLRDRSQRNSSRSVSIESGRGSRVDSEPPRGRSRVRDRATRSRSRSIVGGSAADQDKAEADYEAVDTMLLSAMDEDDDGDDESGSEASDTAPPRAELRRSSRSASRGRRDYSYSGFSAEDAFRFAPLDDDDDDDYDDRAMKRSPS